jgi:hypothetical protein
MAEERRNFDKEILDELKLVKQLIIDMQIGGAVLQDNICVLKEADAHTRLTKLEASGKWMKALAVATPAVGSVIFAALRYFKL